MESRFMRTALSGTSTLRKTTRRSKKLSKSTAPTKIGSRDDSRSDTSIPAAVTPPTWTTTSLPRTASGMVVWGSVWTDPQADGGDERQDPEGQHAAPTTIREPSQLLHASLPRGKGRARPRGTGTERSTSFS